MYNLGTLKIFSADELIKTQQFYEDAHPGLQNAVRTCVSSIINHEQLLYHVVD